VTDNAELHLAILVREFFVLAYFCSYFCFCFDTRHILFLFLQGHLISSQLFVFAYVFVFDLSLDLKARIFALFTKEFLTFSSLKFL
jgi:hypothetical protein